MECLLGCIRSWHMSRFAAPRSHDNFIGRSLGLLAKGGRFVEIGKRDVWSKDEANDFRGWF